MTVNSFLTVGETEKKAAAAVASKYVSMIKVCDERWTWILLLLRITKQHDLHTEDQNHKGVQLTARNNTPTEKCMGMTVTYEKPGGEKRWSTRDTSTISMERDKNLVKRVVKRVVKGVVKRKAGFEQVLFKRDKDIISFTQEVNTP